MRDDGQDSRAADVRLWHAGAEHPQPVSGVEAMTSFMYALGGIFIALVALETMPKIGGTLLFVLVLGMLYTAKRKGII
jgi:hypothetical protein